MQKKLSKNDTLFLFILGIFLLFGGGIINEFLFKIGFFTVVSRVPYSLSSYTNLFFFVVLAIVIYYYVHKIKKFDLQAGVVLVLIILGVGLVFGYGPLLNSGFSNYDLTDDYGLPPLNIAIIERGNEDLNVGDIICYKSRAYGVNVTHRIIAIDGDTITTQGLNPYTNPSPDPSFSRSDVLGKVVTINGYPLYISETTLFFSLIVILFIILYLNFVKKVI